MKFKTLRKLMLEFCDKSSIHGVRYFTEHQRHWIERLWWIWAFCLSIWLCGSSIRQSWLHWTNNSVTISLTETETSISDIPFPTVTICPETKTNINKLDFKYIFKYGIEQLYEHAKPRFNALLHLCPYVSKALKLDHLDYLAFDTIYDTIIDTSLPFHYIMSTYSDWQRITCKTADLLVPVLTDEGLCFAFNALNSRDIYTEVMAPGMMIVKNNSNILHWSLENRYEVEQNQNEYPLRTSNIGLSNSLTVYSSIHEDHLEYVCRDSGLGVKVFLTMPGEEITMINKFVRVPLLSDFQITIKPKLTITSDALRNYPSSQRQCFFSSERRLKFFKQYTKINCEWECLANFTRIMCNCVRFSMPRDNATNICGPSAIKCYESAADKLFEDNNIAESFREHCNCMPACTSIEYNTDISNVPMDLNVLQRSYNKTFDSRPFKVRIFYGNHQVETIKRTETYSVNDFLAICGGLLGLFLGISLLSIVEFLYYFTIRLFFIFRRRERYRRTNIIS